MSRQDCGMKFASAGYTVHLQIWWINWKHIAMYDKLV